jgi:flagella basal body P-ring formation protein FlgA
VRWRRLKSLEARRGEARGARARKHGLARCGQACLRQANGAQRHEELAARKARRAARMVGLSSKELQDVERDVRRVSRQSLVAARDLPSGHVVTPADLEVKRPGTGVCASRFDEVVGRRLARSVAADRVLDEADIAWPVAAETNL